MGNIEEIELNLMDNEARVSDEIEGIDGNLNLDDVGVNRVSGIEGVEIDVEKDRVMGEIEEVELNLIPNEARVCDEIEGIDGNLNLDDAGVNRVSGFEGVEIDVEKDRVMEEIELNLIDNEARVSDEIDASKDSIAGEIEGIDGNLDLDDDGVSMVRANVELNASIDRELGSLENGDGNEHIETDAREGRGIRKIKGIDGNSKFNEDDANRVRADDESNTRKDGVSCSFENDYIVVDTEIDARKDRVCGSFMNDDGGGEENGKIGNRGWLSCGWGRNRRQRTKRIDMGFVCNENKVIVVRVLDDGEETTIYETSSELRDGLNGDHNTQLENEHINIDSSDDEIDNVSTMSVGVLEQMKEEKRGREEFEAIRRRDEIENKRRREESFHEVAKKYAHRFAREIWEEPEESEELHLLEAIRVSENVDDSFTNALKTINERNSELNKGKWVSMIQWTPSHERRNRNFLIPSLFDLSLKVLAKNSDAIVSLEGIPDELKHKLSHLVCGSRRMDCRFMELLVRGSPTEIRVKDSSWMTEEQLVQIFGTCETKKLIVLQLDLCGRCISNYVLRETLTRSSTSLTSLASLSLRGAGRLTDEGLKEIAMSAPSLQSINVGQCSLLSSNSIVTLANTYGSILKELYIDDCLNIDVTHVLHEFEKFKYLEVLSVAGNETVCNKFVQVIVSENGRHMKELVLADCVKLTDYSLKLIGSGCVNLRALDISDLNKLTDTTIKFLARTRRSFSKLKLRRNGFSDEALAAFLEVSGQSLEELSLNGVRKVGPSTALSLANCSRKLLNLDLSWCRNITDEALGLIVDHCSSLRLLKLFGCTQLKCSMHQSA